MSAVEIKLDDVAKIDYTLTDAPLFTSNGMLAGLKVTNLVQII